MTDKREEFFLPVWQWAASYPEFQPLKSVTLHHTELKFCIIRKHQQSILKLISDGRNQGESVFSAQIPCSEGGCLGSEQFPQILLCLSDLALCKQAKHLDFCLLEISFHFSHPKCLCLNLYHCEN